MKKKFQNITNKLLAWTAILGILCIWQVISMNEWVPSYTLPSPIDVGKAFVNDFPLLMENAAITLQETFLGLTIGVAIGFFVAVILDRLPIVNRAFYPIVVISQTIPTVAIAPLLVLWFGYEMTPKIILIVIITFFPITVGLLDGFKTVDPDAVQLMRAMGASKNQIFRYMKAPHALSHFFAGLRISASYSVVGAVIAEWLGGFGGLGVYMIRVKKAFAFDRMFAVIVLISVISLVLMKLVDLLHKRVMPYQKYEQKRK